MKGSWRTGIGSATRETNRLRPVGSHGGINVAIYRFSVTHMTYLQEVYIIAY